MKDDCKVGLLVAAAESIPNTAAALPHPPTAARQAGGTKIAQQRRETDWGSELVPADTTSCIAQIDPAGESMSW